MRVLDIFKSIYSFYDQRLILLWFMGFMKRSAIKTIDERKIDYRFKCNELTFLNRNCIKSFLFRQTVLKYIILNLTQYEKYISLG